jgi:hypothetical protein
MRQTEDDRVGHVRVVEQHLLDFGGEHLLAAGVDDRGQPPEQLDRAVAVRTGPVAGNDVAVLADLEEGLGRLLRIAVVAAREDAAEPEDAEGARHGLELAVLLVEQYRARRHDEFGGEVIR